MSAVLEVENLTVTFGEGDAWRRALGRASDPVVAVDDVSLSVQAGSALGIVGESGSGKSTIMRAVMGLNDPTSGVVKLKGETLGRRRSLETRRAIQMVFQDPGTTLNPARTVGSAIGELLRVHRIVPAAEVHAHVEELLGQVHLPPGIAAARPHQLSGGQKQRVAIARALALRPEILIADEATSALDVVVQASVLDLLAELRTTSGITLICVTHDLDLVRYLCDTAVVMHQGRVVESGPVDAVFTTPTSDYTRELIAAAPTLPVSRKEQP